MDINSLLSPSETPRSTPVTPASPTHSPHSQIQRSNSGTARTNLPTPLSRSILPPSSIPAHIRSPSQQPSHSSPLISPVPSATGPQFPRTSSTQSMDTLADLASMQNHQPVRSTPPLTNSHDSNRSLHRPPLANPRSSFDIAVVETPRELLRSDYTGSSLSSIQQERIGQLAAHVQDIPSAYDAHIEMIKILHEGFVSHCFPPDRSPNGDPRAYDLLKELRQVREQADKLFAVGEDQWLSWLQDESFLAQTAEERLEVIEKCRRAVEEEYGSPELWKLYGDWVKHCYDWASDPIADSESSPDPERLVGRELFTMENVLEVWEQAVAQTKHHMTQSHIVWDKFIDIRYPRSDEKMPHEQAKKAMDVFQDRLQTPHATWDATFQTFSSFISANYSNKDYEEIMATTVQGAAAAKALWSSRESLETILSAAQESGNKDVELQAFAAYVDWESAEEVKARKKNNKRRNPVDEIAMTGILVHNLYQRAELRLRPDVSPWEDHVNYMIDKKISGVRDVLARATKHCPWSGSLWKQQLLSAEIAGESYDSVAAIKHNATKRGMLDAAGIEEVLKVHDAWCGYLLRRTKSNAEDDIDTAMMGIPASIESVQSLASKLEREADFDPTFCLQRKYVELHKRQGRLDNAEKQFKDAIPVYGKHYRFWLHFYHFKMQETLHRNALEQDPRQEVFLNSSAPFAKAVLVDGLAQPELDNPDVLIEALLNHCEDYEDATDLQDALLLANRVQKQLAVRRAQQYAAEQEAAALTAAQAAPVLEAAAEERTDQVATHLHIGKRKRDDEDNDSLNDADVRKRAKPTEIMTSIEQPAASEPKRDREHASILVQNIPESVTETQVRQYFRNCGTVISLKALQDEHNGFIVEFEESSQASYALTRDSQEFGETGAVISVVLNTGSTLYVTNYPAAADETFIRTLFQAYGDIVSVRFPSLQKNKRRRFCYVELKEPRQAQAALELDGKDIDGSLMSVAISDPSIKKARDVNPKKEINDCVIFVGQLPFKATQLEVQKAFSLFGSIEAIKLPRDPNDSNKNKGIAFITFHSSQAAQAALRMDGKVLDPEKYNGRTLRVNIANAEGSGGSRTSNTGTSTSPAPQINGSKVSSAPSVDVEERRLRTIALINVPDIVNEARLHSVAEKIGPVVKVMLRTNHQGALIEFVDTADAGKASIELDEFEVTPGRKVKVTTEKEMNAMQPERKVDGFAVKKAMPKVAVAGQVRRPTQPGVGVRKGPKLGLGFKSVRAVGETNGGGRDLSSGDTNRDGNGLRVGDGEGQGLKKSNDDFRAMLEKSKGSDNA